MTGSPFAHLPIAPPGIPEWEDLLVRLELGPRAVRIAVEVISADARSSGDARVRIAEQLAHLARREEQAAEWLGAMRDGGRLPSWSEGALSDAVAATDGSELDRDRDLRRYSERRARNFADVQRRGPGVWSWRAVHADYGSVSAFQLLSYLVKHDGLHLVVIRSILRADD